MAGWSPLLFAGSLLDRFLFAEVVLEAIELKALKLTDTLLNPKMAAVRSWMTIVRRASTAPAFVYKDVFEVKKTATTFKKLTSDFVETINVGGQEVCWQCTETLVSRVLATG